MQITSLNVKRSLELQNSFEYPFGRINIMQLKE